MTITRRSFFTGLGAVTVGLLFHRHLDAVLESLGQDLVAEPVVPEQRPSAAEIIVIPQTGFRSEQLVVVSTIAASFVIENIYVGGNPQLAAMTEIPAALFTIMALDPPMLRLESAAPATEIRFRVRYVGKSPAGERFLATLIGTRVDSAGHKQRQLLPIDSGCAITA